jgi:hypothetical protein
MKRSTDRILTTHVGSLARPDALVPALRAQDLARPYDQALFEKLAREAVEDVVRSQCAAGIDIVNDGEQSKSRQPAALGIRRHPISLSVSGDVQPDRVFPPARLRN